MGIQRSQKLMKQCLVSDEVALVPLKECLESLTGIAEFAHGHWCLYLSPGNDGRSAGRKSLIFKRRYDLLTQSKIVSPTRINVGQSWRILRWQALLPMLAFDPQTAHGPLIDAGHLKRCFHMPGGACLR
jgi:hypothetical protein